MITPSIDEIIQKIDTGFPSIAHAAIEKARQTKTKLVVWRDGQVVEVDPDDVSIHEKPASRD